MPGHKPDPITLLNQTGSFSDPENAAAVVIKGPARGQIFWLFEQDGSETTTLEIQGKSADGAWGTIHSVITPAAGANTGQFFPSSATIPNAHFVIGAQEVRARLNFTGTPGAGTKAVVEFHPFYD